MSIWYKKELEIDRIDNDSDYCKENCRWVTRKVNSLNKRNTILYKWEPLIIFCEREWINYTSVMTRRYRWNTIDDAIKLQIKYQNT